MGRIDETFVTLDYDTLFTKFDDSRCRTAFLSERDIVTLLTCARLVTWPSRWVGGNSSYPFPGNQLRHLGRVADLAEAIQFGECLQARLTEAMSGCMVEGFQEIATALTKLADAQLIAANKSCCGAAGTPGGPGSGGAGTTPPLPSDGAGSEANSDPPPEGYDTWQEFYDDKCRKAAWITGNISHDITTFTTLQLIGASVVEAAAFLIPLMLDPIPGDEVLVLVGILVATAKYGSDTIALLHAAYEDVKSQVQCALFLALDTDTARNNAVDIVMEEVNSETTDQIKLTYASMILPYLFSNSALNPLFTKDTTRNYPDADCSSCGETSNCVSTIDLHPQGGNAVIEYDYINPFTNVRTIQVHAALEGSVYVAYLRANVSEHCQVHCNSVTVYRGTWTPTPSGLYGYFAENWDDPSAEEVHAPSEFVATGNYWVFYSVSDFGVTVQYSQA